eukprot:ctg_5305.g599
MLPSPRHRAASRPRRALWPSCSVSSRLCVSPSA